MKTTDAMSGMSPKESEARSALRDLALELADQWATGFQERPTQQLVLQKIIDPAVRHIMNSIFPWIVGGTILFLVLFICTVVTCFMVLRASSIQSYIPPPTPIQLLNAAAAATHV
jgi:hypothetical protein